MRILMNWLVIAVTLAIIGLLGIGVHFDSFSALIWASIAVGLINAFLRPILRLLTLPLNLCTLGLFSWVLNAGLLLLASRLVSGFTIRGFLPALFAAVFFAIVHGVLHYLVAPRRR